MYKQLDLDEYKSIWLKAEREFEINCFSIPGCMGKQININTTEDTQTLNDLEEPIPIRKLP